MKNNNNTIRTAITAGILVLTILLTFWLGRITVIPNEVETIKYVEVVNQGGFDMSILERYWRDDCENGSVRMVGAWYYSDGVVEDEQGQLWGLDVEIDKDALLLLWIADNHTSNNIIDDVIIRVWTEVK